jgi:cell wall-associated NlpC family hydrolase
VTAPRRRRGPRSGASPLFAPLLIAALLAACAAPMERAPARDAPPRAGERDGSVAVGGAEFERPASTTEPVASDRPAAAGDPGELATAATSGAQAVRAARAQLGTPYRYGGASPSAGFDCSGLVRWSYAQTGVDLPRDTAAQRRLAATRVRDLSELQPGDLLFYTRGRRGTLHVALFAGDGEFVHAPTSGQAVRADRLDAPHWRARFIEARRLDAARRPVAAATPDPRAR